jgi:prophage tail gpP-like protein
VSGFRTAAGGLELLIDGQIHRGWRSGALKFSIERAAASFELSLAERWSRSADDAPRLVRPGAACTLRLDGEEVLAGHIDSVEINYDHASHTLAVKGREKTGDLNDCAATVDGPYEYRDVTLPEVARRLCQPYGVTVRAEVPEGEAFPRYAIQPTETAWAAIERGCRQRAMLAFGDGRGTLVFTTPGAGGEAAGGLRLGGTDGNIQRAKGGFDWMQRRSLVVVRGQSEVTRGASPAQSREPARGAQAGQRSARATDAEVTRHRPQVLLAEAATAGVTPQQRADWEVATRRGRSRRVTYTVPGWRGGSGRLWRVNTLATVEDSYLALREELLIVATSHSVTAEGSTTELEMMPKDGFDLLHGVKPQGAA